MLPALSYHFHLRWADIETMPQGELEQYLRHLDALNSEVTGG